MKLTTIWTPGMAMSLPEKLRRTRDWAAAEVAARLPLRVRYHVTLQEIARATMTANEVPAATVTHILDHMDRPKVVC